MQNLELQDILNYLLPNQNFLIFDIFLYVIFFLSLITLFMQSDKQLVPTLLMAAVLLSCLIAKVSIGSQVPFRRNEFGMLILNCVIFIFPSLVAAMTKVPKSRGPAVLAAILGFVYTFLYWFLLQR